MAAVQPPKFSQVFDWRLSATMVLTVLIGVIACDLVNASAARHLAPDPVTAPNPASWKTGGLATVDIEIEPKNYQQFECASDRHLEGYRCQFGKNHIRFEWPEVTPRPVPVDNNRGYFIQPYRTAHNSHNLLVAGVWATPGVAYRVHQLGSSRSRPFIARCRLKFLGHLEQVDVSWNAAQDWQKQERTPVALAEYCTVDPPAVAWLARN